jgi:hypothetical protein
MDETTAKARAATITIAKAMKRFMLAVRWVVAEIVDILISYFGRVGLIANL